MRGVFGKCASIFLVISSFLMLNPAASENVVSAENSRVNINLDTVISLSVSEEHISLNVIPEAGGAFAYESASASVSTNSQAGYELEFSTGSEETSLVHGEHASTESRILSLEDPASVTKDNQSNFTMNSWGYTVDNKLENSENTTTTFHPIPEYGSPSIIAQSDLPVSNASTEITFATRVDTSLSAGTYFNLVMFTAIANYVPTSHDFYHINYLQEMDLEVCDSVPTPNSSAMIPDTTGAYTGNAHYFPETTLVDIRDNADYTVRKLADGNCWMSQNLRLGGSEQITLTPDNTDLPAGTTFVLPHAQTINDPVIAWASGESGAANTEQKRVYHSSRTYGNFYNWYTATAGTGKYDMTSGTNATGSLCPKGWTLPSAEGSKSFLNLMTTYGVANAPNSSTTTVSTMFATPLSYTLAGRYSYNGNGIETQASYGYWWTKTAGGGSTIARILTLGKYSNISNASATSPKVNGNSVLCVIK